MFSPYELSSRDRYCRLLPPSCEEFNLSDLRALGLSMRSNRTRIPFARMSPPPPAGYTYAGQFILHDLTRDDTALPHAVDRQACDTVNRNQARLDLSSLYGGGPFSKDRHLYEKDHASLKLGEARIRLETSFDLPLDPKTSRPLLGDSRNNENLILRQIHAMFAKLHNNAVSALRNEGVNDELFAAASERVRWQFQWLIRFDYLQKLCNPAVYRDVIIAGNRCIGWSQNGFSIPVEFSHAVARFGHSMVRVRYELNRENPEFELTRVISEAHKPGALHPSLAVTWQKFFTTREPANNLDTAIPEPMFQLPAEALRRFGPVISNDNPAELPVRTLRRGLEMKLPTGEEVRDALCPGSKISAAPPEFPNYQPEKILVDLGLKGRTPLWYYVLLEAEVNERGANLGELGSRLLAEVIEGALHADPTSMMSQLKQNPKWRPPKWKTSAGDSIDIDTFLDLAIAVGLADDPNKASS
ncbi:MAG: hypothetical protein QOI96_2073 [Verrucomicrobiota bacterium]